MRQACVHLAANLNTTDRRLIKCMFTGPDESADGRFCGFSVTLLNFLSSSNLRLSRFAFVVYKLLRPG